MLLLAVDTSGKDGSIALAQCEPGDTCRIVEVSNLEGGTFSAQLIPQIAALLASHGFTKGDIGGFAVASGPGSFTGLRIGLAAVKALAEVLNKPIAAVSVLESLVAGGVGPGRVAAVLDAGRGDVYVGEYEIAPSTGGLAPVPVPSSHGERLLPRDEWLESGVHTIVVTPDAGVAQAAAVRGLRVEPVQRPRSDVIARLGWLKIMAGKTVTAEALEANYVRRSDAELFSIPER
jgi:tRNA threonylcarbamoyladenosine biosynthesis protein TsaB